MKVQPKDVLEAVQVLYGNEYRYIAEDKTGDLYAYTEKPTFLVSLQEWNGGHYIAVDVKATIDWCSDHTKDKIFYKKEKSREMHPGFTVFHNHVQVKSSLYSNICISIAKEQLERALEIMEELEP